MRPPTLVSRTWRTKARYSRVRVFGTAPWNGMNMSWATSSRSDMPRIQRRTAGDVLSEDVLSADALAGGNGRAAASAGRAAGVDITAAISSGNNPTERGA